MKISNFFWQNLTKDTVHAFQYAQIIRYVSSLLLSIFLVKSSLDLGQIGTFEIMLFFVHVLSFFWITGIKDTLVTQYEQTPISEKETLITTATYSLFGLSFLASTIFFLFHPQILSLFGKNIDASLFGWLSLYMFFSSASNLVEIVLLLRKKSKLLLHYANVNFVFFVLITALSLWFFNSTESLLIVLVVWSFLKFLYNLTLVHKIDFSSATKYYSKDFVYASSSFMVLALLNHSMDIIDSTLVIHYFSTDTFPIFKYGAREIPLSSLLMSSLSTALIPILAKDTHATILRQKASTMMHILFPTSIILMFLSPYLYSWIYSAEFKESAFIFNIYLLILGSRILLPHTYLLAKGAKKLLIISSIIEIIVNVILSLWWVQFWGIYGLAFATVAAYFLHKLVLLFFVKKHLNISISHMIDLKWFYTYNLLAALAFYLSFTYL